MTTKNEIMSALSQFVAQRPGLSWRDYGDATAYRTEQRNIKRDKDDAMTLLDAVWREEGITATDLLEAMDRAFMGRLQWVNGKLEYTTGQYWPTEYRKAVCAVLAYALWGNYRDSIEASNGDTIRQHFKDVFGIGMARRWFDY